MPRGVLDAILLLVVGLIPATVALAGAPEGSMASPRLASLVEAIGAGEPGALERFWAEQERRGTPLIEPAGEPGRVLVTFLWRADPEGNVPNVSVSSRLYIDREGTRRALEQLGSTNVWFATESIPDQTRISYLFAWPQGRRADPDAQLTRAIAGRTYEWFTDPLNPRFHERPLGERTLKLSYLEGPRAPEELWIQRHEGVPEGLVTTSTVTSRLLDNRRQVSVYTPAVYDPEATYPLLLLFDREEYLSAVPTPIILDNMIHAGVIPPLLAVLVGNVDQVTRQNELPPASDTFRRFVMEELLPELRGDYALTRDPTRTVIGGSSYGGLAASWIALHHPDVFGNVLSQSGSFWWHPGVHPGESEDDRLMRMGWLADRYLEAGKLPLRFYLDVGVWEWPNMVLGNRHFRAVLRAAGYPVTYQEFHGAHDYLNWRSTLSEGLIALIGKPGAE